MSSQETKYSMFDMFRDIFRYIRPYRLQFWFAVFCRATSDMANLIPAYAFSIIVTMLAVPTLKTWNDAIPVIIVWILAVYYYRVGHDLAKYFGFKTARYTGFDAKYEGLKHMYRLDLSWHEKENSGNKMKKLDNADKAIKGTIESIFIVIIEAAINIVGVTLIFWNSDQRITYGLLVYIVLYVVLSQYLSAKVSKAYRPISKEEEHYEGLSFESINNIHTLKSLFLYSQVSIRIKESLLKLKSLFRKYLVINRIRNHVLDLFTRVFEFGIYIYIIYQITHNIESIALLILFRGLFGKVIEAIYELSEVYNDLLIDKVYLSRFHDLLEVKPTIEAQPNQKQFPAEWQNISLNHLSFAYGAKSVLKDLNFGIKRGEKIGIVGISGAGKSTFVKLMLDLYENYQGDIMYDQTSLREIAREDYINHIAVVSQDTELFNTTLSDNILIAETPLQGKLTHADLEQACFVANLNDVVAKLPDGFNTIIGEKGFKLSGGERQRVGIARAIIRHPQLIVLDEATSHLDSDSEQKIQKALDALFVDVTAIVIAHRLSTLTKMDRIIVLENGKIVEQGTIEELIALNGKFKFFWDKQNQVVDN